jgi:uncharacterized protein
METAESRPVAAFLFLLIVLWLPFLAIGLTGVQLLPGLPLSALGAVCPAAAALILCARRGGPGAAHALLARAGDWGRVRPRAWFVGIVLAMPAALALSYLIMRLIGAPLPELSVRFELAPLMLAAFLVTALGEELGWTGYLLEPLQQRLGPLRASLFIGAVWAAWHVLPYLQAHRSWTWIAWQCFGAVALRVILVWLYSHAGPSVFAAALFHAMVNVSEFLFPNLGSHYDPRITGLVFAAMALVLVVARPARATTA